MKVLSLLTDAYGGRGGIAQFNRDMLGAICGIGHVEVTAIPRLVTDEPRGMPPTLRFERNAARGRAAYVAVVLRQRQRTRFDTVICSHLNLLPLAAGVAMQHRARLLLVIYGLEAWRPAQRVTRLLLRRVDHVVSISEFTKGSFLEWARVPEHLVTVIPCCVEADRFAAGPKSPALVNRYGLAGRRVLMTVARLSHAERYKGVDEVIGVLPMVAESIPNISYLVVGDGPDRRRLETKAHACGVADRVVFAGYIDEAEKAVHYRLADLFVMPGRGEGFGIVYLEAMACGIPVIASTLDASRETMLGGRAGDVVNPDEPEELRLAILRGLGGHDWSRGRTEALEYFSAGEFRRRWQNLLSASAVA